MRPFSHIPGSRAMIPGSSWIVEAYPTKINFIQESKVIPLTLGLQGPCVGFTLQQDLEKNQVIIFGSFYNARFVKIAIAHTTHVIITLQKGDLIPYQLVEKKDIWHKKKSLVIGLDSINMSYLSQQKEKLFLGMHKQLNWPQVMQRMILREILPVLFTLGQKIPPMNDNFPSIEMPKTEKEFDIFLRGRFHHLLLPTREDNNNLGLDLNPIEKSTPLKAILRQSYEAIRNVFFQENQNEIEILPLLSFFPQFISGRMTSIHAHHAMIDIEWSKRKIKKISLRPKKDGPIFLKFPKQHTSYRLRNHPKEQKGSIMTIDMPIFLERGKIFFLDKFQK